ncbi:leucine--tRNA ligase [archaeon SCG-AAA382B04]|nr:leucine--tRNA ligase [archaeon SCG-AAA382B04]
MTNDYSFQDIEEKWIKKWQKNDVFNVKKDQRDSYFVNVAYPYPSGSMHVGHGRTYTLPDIVARYKRMDGYNVLFPMAWHVTGTPVIGISRRIKEEDEDTLDIYKNLYGVPEEKIGDFKDPLEIVNYFSDEYKKVMTRLGYSIDWDREFRTVDDEYNSFIEWQYRRLKDKGLIKKGTHPVKYCPNDENALGDHDLLEGEEAGIEDFFLIKFELDNGDVLPCATLRPETVLGVTNLWIKPSGQYVKVDVGEERWIVAKKAIAKLREQGWMVEEIEEIKGEELIGKEAETPRSESVPILEADFVDLDVATGVVMSVPAHAPYDLIALKELETDIFPKKVIDLEEYGDVPAQKMLEKYNVSNQIDDSLEDATEELYNKEFNNGFISSGFEDYSGLDVKSARKQIGEDLVSSDLAEKMYEFDQKPVVCRCGEDAVVKVLEDQWFLDYSDRSWKQKTHDALRDINLIPSDIEKDFDHAIDWLEEWACTRRVGLGTNLPWDKEWIIEPLSDSTIYMSYYTISKLLKDVDGDLKDELFDYLFLDKGDVSEISEKTGIEKTKIKEMKEEFEYWYPYDYRFSAKDLIPNHLTFQLFHHTALFDEEKWPQGISVLGMGLLEGEKMSSSKGHVVLLENAIEKYGSDTVRFFLVENAEPWQDFDWRENDVKSTQNKLMHFWDNIEKYLSFEDFSKNLEKIDYWLLSRFNERVKKTRESLENHQTRKALQNAFYLFRKDLGWYKKRTNIDREGAKWCLNKVSREWIKLLAPFIPFIAEEVWSKIGDSFVSEEAFPRVESEYINRKVEFEENLLREVREDVNEIINVTDSTPEKIYLYTSSQWKDDLIGLIAQEDDFDQGKLMGEIMKRDEFKKRGEEVNRILDDLIEIVREHNEYMEYASSVDLGEVLEGASDYLEKEFDCDIIVTNEKNPVHDPQNKSKNALPLKPAIYLE